MRLCTGRWDLFGKIPGVGFLALAALLFLFVATRELDAAPAIDWDEGWTFTVAQNWVEHHFYGRLLNGQFAPPGLEASFPVVSTVALAMQLFGVGIWQGRLAAVLPMLVALVLLWLLTRQFFDTSVAFAALAILICLIPHPRTNAFWMARAMFAEPLQCVTILVGFEVLLLARRGTRLLILAAIVFWALAFTSKAQVLPFLMVSALSAIGMNLVNHRPREAFWLGVSLGGAFIGWRLLLILFERILAGWTLPPNVNAEIFTVAGFVPSPSIRLTAVIVTVLIGTPIVLGLGYFCVQRFARRDYLQLLDRDDDLRVALWVLAVTWLLWYVLLSQAGIVRYLFSPLFFGAPFAAVMFRDFTGGFNLKISLERMTLPLRQHAFTRTSFGAWLAFLLILFYFPLTLYLSYLTMSAAEGHDVTATADYLNHKTPANARIETYESPLFIILNRSYHYPPDALHLELNKRAAQLPAKVDYDPLVSNPDYFVIGPVAHIWRLYDPLVERGDLVLLKSFGQYEIYQRTR